VADAFEALTSDRSYRGRKSPEEACALIEAWSGMQFDPAVVTTLRQNLGQLIVSPYRAPQSGTGPAVPGGSASGPLGAAEVLGLWGGASWAEGDPGGFGESLHRGIGAGRIDGLYAGPGGGAATGPAGDQAGAGTPGLPGPLDALQQGVSESSIWLERDESGAIVGRQTAVLSTISSAHREVYSLYEIAQALGSSLRLPDVLDLVATKIGQLVPYRSCVIYLLEDHSDSLSARFVSGANVDNLRGRALRVGEGITGWAALQKSNRFSQSVDLDLAGAGLDLSEYSTAAAFPLIYDGQALGVITLYFPKGVPCLDDHIRMMDIIVRLAAAAVHNGTLFAETQESALTDGLTNLPNSRYLRQVFEQEKVRSQQAGQPMAFLEADLDNFKVINDRFGHHVGDRYLSEISRVLKSHLRERDILVRLSGDEFAALLPMTGFAQAALLAERLQQAVELFRVRDDVRPRRRHAGLLQHARGDDLVAQGHADRVRIQDRGALLVQAARDAQGDVGARLENVEIVFDLEPRQLQQLAVGVDDLNFCAPVGEQANDLGHDRALARVRVGDHEEADAFHAQLSTWRRVLAITNPASRSLASGTPL